MDGPAGGGLTTPAAGALQNLLQQGDPATVFVYHGFANGRKAMFTPVMLVCVMNTCFAVSGNAYPTEERCQVDMQSNGVAFVQSQFPNARIVSMRCINWGQET